MKKRIKKNTKENHKDKAGITLIALVVTIIILLILAGISIQMLAGNNGILTRAKEAKINWENASSKEQQVLNDIEQQMAEIINENTGEIDENTLVGMFKKAQKESCTNENGTCTDSTHLHIGDYVNYINPTSGEYTVPAGEVGGENAQTYLVSQNQLNWRVLGIEGTGNSAYIKLIAGSPMKKSKSDKSEVDEGSPYLYMRGAKSCLNSVAELNKICALYKNANFATEAVSITMDDIDKITGVTTTELKQQYNADQIGGGKTYGESYSFSDQYTPESWLTSTKTTVSGTIDGYYYYITNSQDGNSNSVVISNTRVYNMLFDNVEFGSGKAYWLASVGASVSEDFVRSGTAAVDINGGELCPGNYYMFNSLSGEQIGYSFAVRPVVFLKPGVTNEQCPKIEDKTEPTWNVGG